MLKKFPKIKNNETFEYLARDVMEKRLKITLNLYGRKGQPQNGIDLYTNDKNGIVVQCKDYLKKQTIPKIEQVVKSELEKAKSLNIAFKQFWFVTALDRDVSIQGAIEEIQCPKNIYFLFWEDIEEILSYNHDIAKKYYPQYYMVKPNHASLLFLGFISQIFTDRIDMIQYQRNDALSLCYHIENGLSWVTNNNTKLSLLESLKNIENYLTEPINIVDDFKNGSCYTCCQAVEKNILSIQNTLNYDCLIYFRIGIKLGKIDHLIERFPETMLNDGLVKELEQLINYLKLDADDKNMIHKYLKMINDKFTRHQIPEAIFNFLYNRI